MAYATRYRRQRGTTHIGQQANSHFNERGTVPMKRVFTILFLLLLATTAHGQSITQLFAFACSPYPSCPDGTKPDSIIQASDDNLYGTTAGPGGGGIFKITEAGKITVLYTFTTNPRTGFYDQGYDPTSLAEGTDGFLYGVNSAGGPNSASSGTIFKISKTGTGFRVLQTFCTSCATGANPNSLVAGSDGNMYGTTGYGGSFNSKSPYCPSLGCGVIFRLTPPGTYTVLYALNVYARTITHGPANTKIAINPKLSTRVLRRRSPRSAGMAGANLIAAIAASRTTSAISRPLRIGHGFARYSKLSPAMRVWL